MVVIKHPGSTKLALVGPWTSAGVTSYLKDAEIIWIKFKLGTFMPHQPVKAFRNRELILPDASGQSFWFNDSALPFPDFDYADVFVNRLVQKGLLALDARVQAALNYQESALAARTVRHRFLQTTGLSFAHIQQVERAQRAAALLRAGVSIVDTMFELEFFDQPGESLGELSLESCLKDSRVYLEVTIYFL